MCLKRIANTKDRIREAMMLCQKKQIDLVKETGLNRSMISRYLSGQYEPKSEAINKIAIALNCSEMWLWGYDVPRERPATKKKSNTLLADLIERLKSDTEFSEIVFDINSLNREQLLGIKQILKAFGNKNGEDTE